MTKIEKFVIPNEDSLAELYSAGNLGKAVVDKLSTSIIFRGEPEDWISLEEQNTVFELFNYMESESMHRANGWDDGTIRNSYALFSDGSGTDVSYAGLEASIFEYIKTVDQVAKQFGARKQLEDIRKNPEREVTDEQWYETAGVTSLMLNVLEAAKLGSTVRLRELTYEGWTYKLTFSTGFATISRGKRVGDSWQPRTSAPHSVTVVGSILLTDNIGNMDEGDFSG